ncbi:auxin efflux carrier [Cystobasidium minutum MCA 4210]|uniref:auxin efflux carrier n=1 Tax=Cystobasidium minutum MCA 4210 TaxID=1397322 RepID=UPI0034CE84B3|eukprot:jgi/Rhomi1/73661/CE73660_4388
MSAGTYIWQGLKPTLKMVMTIGCGYILTKKGLFPPAASKGLSQVAMNIGLPCLLFSSMVPSFNDSNIQNFGPLSLVAILFVVIGTTLFAILREIFYVPGDFQWGFLMLGAMSNWGNLPIAVVQSVGTETPFDPSKDQALGIAYIAVFILIMNAMFYGVGTYRICGWDFRDKRPEIPRTFAGRMARRRKQLDGLFRWFSKTKHTLALKRADSGLPNSTVNQIEEGATTGVNTAGEERPAARRPHRAPSQSSFPVMERVPSSHADVESLAWEETSEKPPYRTRSRSGTSASRPGVAAALTIKTKESKIQEEDEEIHLAAERDAEKGEAPSSPVSKEEANKKDEDDLSNVEVIEERPKISVWRSIWMAIRPMLTPATMGVIFSIPIALVQPLKALFVEVPGWTGMAIRNAPDGKPPLAFFFDFTSFVGGMTVPGGLIILGASFARIKISKESLREMPKAAIIASVIAKMAVAPLIGILMIIGFRDTTTLFPPGEKMLSFTAFLLSGTPSAINQLVATQIFAKEGQSLDTVSTFLLAQYSLLLLQSAALTAISLWLAA